MQTVDNATAPLSDNSSKQTRRYNNIEYHQKFICTVCDRIMVNKAVLIKHMMTAHMREVYQCSLCRRSFNAEGKLKKHIEMQHCAENDTNTCKTAGNDEPVAKRIKLEKSDGDNGENTQVSADTDTAKKGTNIDGSTNRDSGVNDEIGANNKSGAKDKSKITVSIKQEPREDNDVSIDVSMEVDTVGDDAKPQMNTSSAFEDYYYETDSKSIESDDDDNNNDNDDDDEDYKPNSTFMECKKCEIKFHSAKGSFTVGFAMAIFAAILWVHSISIQ